MSSDVSVENLQQLRDALQDNKVPACDKDFASSLVRQADAKGFLSASQWHWVGVLVSRATRPVPVSVIPQFSGVYDLFKRAATRLKYPKVRLQTELGTPLQLYISGERSRVPGVVNVVEVHTERDKARWFGRVMPDGTWQQNPRLSMEDFLPVGKLLKRLASDPAKVASEYGRLTGNCCFCYRKLDDERSTAVGYGPHCAKQYGLPWGQGRGSDSFKEPVEKDKPTAARRVRVRKAVAV